MSKIQVFCIICLIASTNSAIIQKSTTPLFELAKNIITHTDNFISSVFSSVFNSLHRVIDGYEEIKSFLPSILMSKTIQSDVLPNFEFDHKIGNYNVIVNYDDKTSLQYVSLYLDNATQSLYRFREFLKILDIYSLDEIVEHNYTIVLSIFNKRSDYIKELKLYSHTVGITHMCKYCTINDTDTNIQTFIRIFITNPNDDESIWMFNCQKSYFFQIVNHEFIHAFTYMYNLKYIMWFNEGLAEYYSTSNICNNPKFKMISEHLMHYNQSFYLTSYLDNDTRNTEFYTYYLSEIVIKFIVLKYPEMLKYIPNNPRFRLFLNDPTKNQEFIEYYAGLMKNCTK